MSQPQWVQKAMSAAIRRVRFETARLHLPGDEFGDDTDAIREATRLYIESWVVPLLEAVRDGDRRRVDIERLVD